MVLYLTRLRQGKNFHNTTYIYIYVRDCMDDNIYRLKLYQKYHDIVIHYCSKVLEV